MQNEQKQHISASFPASLEFVPLFREFISDVLKVHGHSDKFSYRSEVIVDELCGNAIKFGSPFPDSRITTALAITKEDIALSIQDEGGEKEDVERLQKVVDGTTITEQEEAQKMLGLKIVKMLADSIHITLDDTTVTKVEITRNSENS